jgi:hypothetical protein
MKILISILLLTACALYLARADESRTNQSTGSTSPPTLPHASVELPWNEFRTLWENTQAPKPPAPLTPEYAIVESRFILDWSADPTQIAASWIVDNFASEPRWVTLLPPDAILGPQNEDDAPAAIARQAGGIAFLLPQKGRTTFRALLLGTRESSPQGREVIRFPTGSPGITVVEIRNLPEDLEVGIPGGTAMRRNSAVATFVLAATATEASVVIKSTAKQQEAVWEWQAEAVVKPEATLLKYEVRVSATLLSGDGEVLRLPVPNGIRAPQIDAPGLESWSFVAGDPAHIELLWRDDTIRTRQFLLRYEQPLAFGSEDWTLITPPRSEAQSPTVLAVLTPAGLEISGAELRENAGEAPASQWLRAQLENREFVLLQSRGMNTVRAKNLPLAEPANLVISRMNAVTRIVKDGAVLTEIEASVRADAPGRWIVSLPAETELLRCTARGETIRPVRRGESLEIPILPSANEKEIKIHLSYTGKLNPLDPVAGGVVLSLPETAEFIDSVEWQLHFPSEFRVAGLESLAEILPAEPGQPLRLRQQLVRGSKIQAGIFYRKHGIE